MQDHRFTVAKINVVEHVQRMYRGFTVQNVTKKHPNWYDASIRTRFESLRRSFKAWNGVLSISVRNTAAGVLVRVAPSSSSTMSDEIPFVRPWLIAVWPGMGHVAISAGYYLISKLEMELFAEISAPDLFDVDFVDVKDGLIQAGKLPRSRFFMWKDPHQQNDLIVFLGEAQPPLGKFSFCHRLVQSAQTWGVERLFTFAAMASHMNPENAARVYGTASTKKLLEAVTRHGAEPLEEGRISGLNGVLLAAAAEAGLEGICLLGEMPHLFAQLPFPKASLAVLEVFRKICGLDLDLKELEEQSEAVSKRLGELLAQVEQNMMEQQRQRENPEEEEYGLLTSDEDEISSDDKANIERLFDESKRDRSKAFELKGLLDQLGVFSDYENRFLDLFKKQE